MVIVQIPLKREYIVELLNGKTIEGITFTFVKEERMKLYFEVSGNSETAAAIAKKTIKQSPLGSALFYNVLAQ